MRVIEVLVPLEDSATVARTGSTHSWDTATTPDGSRDDDAATQWFSGGVAPIPGTNAKMQHLKRYGFTTPAEAVRYPLSYLKVRTICFGGGPTSDPGVPTNDTIVYADSICLVKGGTILTSMDKGDETDQYLGVYETRDYTFTRADLETLGITRAELLASPADFGAAIGMRNLDADAAAGNFNRVDMLALVFGLLVDEDDMDYHKAAMAGGWKAAAAPSALPSVSSSAAIFSDVPDDVTLIELTVRTADLVIRWNIPGATTAATTTNGNTYAAGGTYKLHGNKDTFLAARGIQSGGTAAGTITYWKAA